MASPSKRPRHTTGRSAITSGSWMGSRSFIRKPRAVSFRWVSTGEETYSRNRAASVAAWSGRVRTKASPCPARAIPSMRWRFTEVPMPKVNRLALPRFWRMRSKTWPSALM